MTPPWRHGGTVRLSRASAKSARAEGWSSDASRTTKGKDRGPRGTSVFLSIQSKAQRSRGARLCRQGPISFRAGNASPISLGLSPRRLFARCQLVGRYGPRQDSPRGGCRPSGWPHRHAGWCRPSQDCRSRWSPALDRSVVENGAHVALRAVAVGELGDGSTRTEIQVGHVVAHLVGPKATVCRVPLAQRAQIIAPPALAATVHELNAVPAPDCSARCVARTIARAPARFGRWAQRHWLQCTETHRARGQRPDTGRCSRGLALGPPQRRCRRRRSVR